MVDSNKTNTVDVYVVTASNSNLGSVNMAGNSDLIQEWILDSVVIFIRHPKEIGW